ncbi:MAG: CBS domain-containing protein [Nitrospirae bacterium]|nr:CBS domain-containing protein [Nitrospirota bacterium]
MQIRTNTRLARRLFLDRDTELLRQQLFRFQPFLSRRKASTSLEEFDADTERLISRVFGESSELLQAYGYAKLGEAASLVNLPEEAQESGAQDIERESLQQRKRILESCLSTLEDIRNTRMTAGQVANYMSTEIRSVHIDATLKEVGNLLKKWKVGSLLVDDGRRYVGIITDTDLSRKGAARGLDPSSTTVSRCMAKPIMTIEDSEPMTAAVDLMKNSAIRHLGVTVDGTIMGVLSVADILRYYADLVPTLRDLAGLTPEGGETLGED